MDTNPSNQDIETPLVQGEQYTQQSTLQNSPSKFVNPRYNPLASPPDIDKAFKHARASRVGHIPHGQNDLDMCEDCGRAANNEQLPLTDNLEKAGLGVGFLLYFQYILGCGILIAAMFVMVGLYDIISDIMGTRCELEACAGGFIISQSAKNRSKNDSYTLTGWLLFIYFCSTLVFSILMRVYQKKTINKFGSRSITAANFTLFIKGLPAGEHPEDIKAFFEKNGRSGFRTEVKKVVMAYEVERFVALEAKRDELRGKINRDNQNGSTEHVRIGQVETNIAMLRHHILSNHTSNTTGVAFVSFGSNKEAEDVLKQFEMNLFDHILLFLCCCTGCIGSTSKKLYKGKKIGVEPAPEATDVIWENLGFSWSKVIRRGITLFAASCVIFWSGIISFNLISQKANQSSAQKQTFMDKIQPQITAIMIIVFNVIIEKIVRYLATFEKHFTHTKHNISVSKLLSVLQIINVFVTILVQYEQNRKKNPNQLSIDNEFVSSIFWLLFLNALLPPIKAVLNPKYLYQRYKQQQLLKNPQASKMTQHQANQLFEGPKLDVNLSYVQIQKTILLTAFFAPLLPIVGLFATLALGLQYCTDKYLLLRRYSRPRSLGKDLAAGMLDFVDYFLFFFLCGKLIFVPNGLASFYNFFGFILSLTAFCNIFFPHKILMNFISPEKDPQTGASVLFYDQSRSLFVSDYDKTNPILKEHIVSNHYHVSASGNIQ